MQVTVEIDDALVAEACKLSKEDTAEATITAAVRGYVENGRRYAGLFELMGTVEYYNDDDYKAARSGKRNP